MRLATMAGAALLALAGCGGGPEYTVPSSGPPGAVEARITENFPCWMYDEEFRSFWGYGHQIAEEDGRRVIEFFAVGGLGGMRPVYLRVEPREGSIAAWGQKMGYPETRGRILRDLAFWGAGGEGCGPEHVPWVP